MATSAIVPTATGNPYGLVVVDGLQYIERFQIYTDELTISAANEVHTHLRLTMPGTANFLLKGLTRDITIVRPGPERAAKVERLMRKFHVANPRDLPGSQDRRFRFKLTNMESSAWFFSSGLGSFDDRVIDTMCFGMAQFPYMLVPPIPVQATGTLIYEVEDMGLGDAQDPDYYPYTIHFGFIGSLLIPVQQAGAAQAWLYSVSGGKL